MNKNRFVDNGLDRSCDQLVGVSEFSSSIDSLAAQLLFNSQQLVVLGQSLRTARSSSLDLTS